MNNLVYGRTVNAFWLVAVASVVIVPDVIFGAMVEVLHLALELCHLAFELFESALDHLVEHTFHTETKETQIIVFYIMVTMGLVAGYFLWSAIKHFYQKAKTAFEMTVHFQTQRFLLFWAESAANKFKLIAGVNMAMTVVYLVAF